MNAVIQSPDRKPDGLCVICRDDFKENDERWTCGSKGRDKHDPFHKPCLIEWVNENPICPHDRTPINLNSLLPTSQLISHLAKKVVVNSAFSVGLSSSISLISLAFNTQVSDLIKTEASRLISDPDIIADAVARGALSLVRTVLPPALSILTSSMSGTIFNTEVSDLIKTEASRLIPHADNIADAVARGALGIMGLLGVCLGLKSKREIDKQPELDRTTIYCSSLASIPLLMLPVLGAEPYTYAPLAAGIAACIGTCVNRFRNLLP